MNYRVLAIVMYIGRGGDSSGQVGSRNKGNNVSYHAVLTLGFQWEETMKFGNSARAK